VLLLLLLGPLLLLSCRRPLLPSRGADSSSPAAPSGCAENSCRRSLLTWFGVVEQGRGGGTVVQEGGAQ